MVNECDGAVPWTRTHEFKHFTPERSFKGTVLYRERSFAPGKEDEKYYPVRAPADLELLERYRREAEASCPEVRFGGRLGGYRYLDMDQSISAALRVFEAWPGGAR